MIFNKHSDLAGEHAFLSASKYQWLNYDDDKLLRMLTTHQAAARGSRLHALAHECINLGVRLPTRRTTLNLYVNDGIGWKMTTEQVLYYSPFAYGTADAIAFRRKILRISDLKTGWTATSEKQLEVYSALFCLEYEVNPFDIEIQLRIYQNDDVRVYIADPDDITHHVEKIIYFDKLIREYRMEEMS